MYLFLIEFFSDFKNIFQLLNMFLKFIFSLNFNQFLDFKIYYYFYLKECVRPLWIMALQIVERLPCRGPRLRVRIAERGLHRLDQLPGAPFEHGRLPQADDEGHHGNWHSFGKYIGLFNWNGKKTFGFPLLCAKHFGRQFGAPSDGGCAGKNLLNFFNYF